MPKIFDGQGRERLRAVGAAARATAAHFPAACAKRERARSLVAARIVCAHWPIARRTLLEVGFGRPWSDSDDFWTGVTAAAVIALVVRVICLANAMQRRATLLMMALCICACVRKIAMCSGHGAAGMMFFCDHNMLHEIAHPWALCGRAGGSGAARLAKRGFNG